MPGINTALEDKPELVNDDAYGSGWLIKIAISDPAESEELLSAADYEATL